MAHHTINDVLTVARNVEGALLANRYRIVRQLGQGGMGSVWLAEDTQLDNKPFAIKMLPSILVANKRAYRQLKDEALVAIQLVHPNIVQIRAFEENSGNPFLVMDYIDGQTLDDYLAENGNLSEKEVIRVLRPIAAALDYAHTKGVVHRDVKPGNVMIAKDGTPYILDFGIAREIQETMTRVTGKLSSGTLLYMSPEQLMGDKPTPAQDIYSFAAMAYECLNGEPPFVRGAIEDQIRNKQPEPLLVGTSFCSFVMSGLAKNPEDRPATCAAVLGGKSFSRVEHVERVENDGDRDVAPCSLQAASLPCTQADCVRLMADAKVVKRHIAMFSDDPAFKKEIQEIEDDFVRADIIFEKKQWALAAEYYARIAERGKVLEEGVACRAAEAKARLKAEEQASREAEEKARLAALPKTGDVKTVTLPGGAIIELIYVAPGAFLMGSPETETGRFDNEILHRVTLTSGYWLGKYAVTQKQWQSVMGRNPSHFKGGEMPVDSVSWEDAQRFIKKVNASASVGARLPTEAEWEYACRAGATGAYSGTDKLDDVGWYDNTILGFGLKPYPVGQKQSNTWGFYDMHGNVLEWCQDWYDNYPSGSVTNPQGPVSGSRRVLRGGSWLSTACHCRSACRSWSNPGYCGKFIGFRLCCCAE